MGNGQGRQGRQVRLTPEQMAELQEVDRQWRLEFMPPQVDANGLERVCVACKGILNPLHNKDYDGSVGGFCNKLCAADYETKMMREGKDANEAMIEVEKYEDWKPRKHSPVAVS